VCTSSAWNPGEVHGTRLIEADSHASACDATSPPEVSPFHLLPAAMLRFWERLFDRQGSSITQHPRFAAAAAEHSSGNVVVLHHEGGVAAFSVTGDSATSLFSGAPQLGGRLSAQQVATALDCAELYWPLLNGQAPPGVATWERLPSPFVDWSDRGTDLLRRVRDRHGSQADRKWRRFEAGGLRVRLRVDDPSADVREIESRSWKAGAGQAMHQRGQLGLYSTLLSEGIATADIAYLGQRPVAYRIDAQIGDEVACLKWSFDERFRRFSPGFYLLTVGLRLRYADSALERIDLHGSPDTLKALVATDSRPRLDAAWATNYERVKRLRRERTLHDERIREVWVARKGVRHAYGA
jgi:hypothetical protein